MDTRTVVVARSEGLVNLLDPPEAAARLREAAVLDLLRQERITQGEAAYLLGMTLWDFFPIMARRRVQSGPATPEEPDRERADLCRQLEACGKGGGGGRQQQRSER